MNKKGCKVWLETFRSEWSQCSIYKMDKWALNSVSEFSIDPEPTMPQSFSTSNTCRDIRKVLPLGSPGTAIRVKSDLQPADTSVC